MSAARPVPGSNGDGPSRLPAVLTIASAITLIGEPAVRWRLRSGRWQRPCRGVLVTHSGGVSDAEWLWVAVLGAGPHALLGGLTAARLDGLKGFDDRGTHLLLPACRQVRTCLPGVVVHRSGRAGRAAGRVRPARASGRRPPHTRIDDTVIDLTQTSASFGEAFSWLGRAVVRGLTTPRQLSRSTAGRARLHWRAEIGAALAALARDGRPVREK